MDKKPRFVIETAPNGRWRVVEPATDLIWRTLATRQEASNWLAQAEPPAREGRVKTR